MSLDPELQSLRAAMDVANTRLVAVLHERARLVRKIGAWKRRHAVPGADPAREDAMLAAMLRNAPADGFAPEALTSILRAVFATSRKLVTES